MSPSDFNGVTSRFESDLHYTRQSVCVCVCARACTDVLRTKSISVPCMH